MAVRIQDPVTSIVRRRSSDRGGVTLIELLIVLTIAGGAVAIFSLALLQSTRLGSVARETALASDAARAIVEELRNAPFEDVFALYNDDPTDDPLGEGTAPGGSYAVEGLVPLDGAPDGRVLWIEFPTVTTGELAAEGAGAQEDPLSGGLAPGAGAASGSGTEADKATGTGRRAKSAPKRSKRRAPQVLVPAGGGLAAPAAPLPLLELREDVEHEALGMPRDLDGDGVVDALDHRDDYVVLPVCVHVEWQGRLGARRHRTYTMLTRFRP